MSDAPDIGIERCRATVELPSGVVSYLDTGRDDTGGDRPPALFVHGVATASTLWRNALPLLADHRRCIAVDLPLHGQTAAAAPADFSFEAMAGFLADFCDALGLKDIDLVGNDTGGAIAQVFAVRQSRRLRTFTLTNCDTLGNLPPKAFMPTVLMARARLLAPQARLMRRNLRLARRAMVGSLYQDVRNVPETVVAGWLDGAFRSKDTAKHFQRWIGQLNDSELAAIDPQLRELHVPTLLVWGTGDRFFKLRWAEQLRDTIPGADRIVEIPDGRLFFVDERAAEFADAVRDFWLAHAAEKHAVRL